MTNYKDLKELAYKCENKKLIESVDSLKLEELSIRRRLKISLLKACAFFELHRVDEAKKLLKDITNECVDSDALGELGEDYLYVKAKIGYFDGNYEAALDIFEEILEKTKDVKHRFRSFLGIGNILYSQRCYADQGEIIKELREFEPIDKLEDRLSLMILIGNYYLALGENLDVARSYFKSALALASKRGWKYFVNRCLYGLALEADKSGNAAGMLTTLEILRGFVDESEAVYFSYLVNKKFGHLKFTIDSPIEVDPIYRRVLVNDKWISFEEAPEQFDFIGLLHQQRDFVQNEIVAAALWPEEQYTARKHDLKISVLARKARESIEAYTRQPVLLLCNNNGYKLASA